MEAAKSFDAYEVIGIITPGAVLGLVFATQWPELRGFLGREGLSVGDLGFFVIMAFVLGHLVQALGNIVEAIFWAPKGMPTAWIRPAHQTLVSLHQRAAIESKVAAMEGAALDIAKIDRKGWRSLTGRMYARVRTAGRSARIDSFNRTYGLSRGLAAAFIVVAAWYWFDARAVTEEAAIAAVLAIVALYRMYRASVHYACALFVEFVDLP